MRFSVNTLQPGYWLHKWGSGRNSIPADQARQTNARFERSALLVEKLFDRPLRPDARVAYLPAFVVGEVGVAHPNGLVVVPPRHAKTIVHELTHVQDPLLQESPWAKSRSHRMAVLEGRAVFASTLLKGRPKRFEPHFWGAAISVAVVGFSLAFPDLFGAVHSKVSEILNHAPLGPSFMPSQDGVRFLSVASTFFCGMYWLFHNSLCALSKAMGDPYKAFRATTEKPPTSWSAILFPLKFYEKEIEAARNPGPEA